MIPLLAINIDVQSALSNLSGTGNFTIITSVGVMVSRIIGLFLAAGTLAAFVYFVWGGLQMITAGSDKGKVEEARSRITNAIIGLVVIAVSWAVFGLINYFFGLNLIGEADDSSAPNPYSTPAPSSSGSGGTCIYPASRCCSDLNSNCFCQNTLYHAVSSGSCTTGSGQAGTLCSCVRN